MTGLLIGYARCSTDGQDLTAQRNALTDLGVEASRIYVDYGHLNRRELTLALAALVHAAGSHHHTEHLAMEHLPPLVRWPR